jgi:hypothetical protein
LPLQVDRVDRLLVTVEALVVGLVQPALRGPEQTEALLFWEVLVSEEELSVKLEELLLHLALEAEADAETLQT